LDGTHGEDTRRLREFIALTGVGPGCSRPAPVDDYHDLRPARHAKNITLATDATHFGVPIITVSRLERGHQRNEALADHYRRWLTAA
jgi:transposase